MLGLSSILADAFLDENATKTARLLINSLVFALRMLKVINSLVFALRTVC